MDNNTKKVTMRDIAKIKGVSAVTVSKALGGKDGVSAELRAEIMKCADELGYKYSPNSGRSSDGISINSNIGVLVPDRFFSDSTFYFGLYRTLLTKAAQRGYTIVLEIVPDNDELSCNLPQMIRSSKVDGLIFLGEFSVPYIQHTISAGIPFIFLDFYCYDFQADSIVSDNTYGSYMLTNKLFDNGHKKIGFVGSVKATSSIIDRYLGFNKSLMMHDCAVRSDWILEDRGMDGIIFESIKLPAEMPDAFVCNCDETAYVLIRSLEAAGYKVPEDVSVVGFDDFNFANRTNPSLTTFRVNVEAMGDAAISLLVRKIRRKSYTSGKTVIPGTLVMRDSIFPRR